MSGRAKRRHAEDEEEHENHERWLVSYADMITVLMALFIVMFAISNVDQAKFDQLRASLATSFGNPVVAIDGGASAVESSPVDPGPFDIGAAAMSAEDAEEQGKAVDAAVARRELARATERRRHAEAEFRRLDGIRERIRAALRKEGLEKSVRFRYDERGLVVSIVTDEVIFPADRATLGTGGRDVLEAIAPALGAVPNGILVEGHTNTVPVAPKYYPTEWELSSARAVTVVRFLVEHEGLDPRRLTAAGFADQRPLIEGTSALANRLNRRVEVVVASTLPPDERALLPQVATDGTDG